MNYEKIRSLTSKFSGLESSAADEQIDTSLTKLFHCMSVVYGQQLSSPRWNRFLGLKLRWKDKVSQHSIHKQCIIAGFICFWPQIRLNNVIWRCWHMQFIARKRKLAFAFDAPRETEEAVSEGGGAIMMGRYWRRRMHSVLAEYKKWRIFYKNQNTCPRYRAPRKLKVDKALDSLF